MGRGIPSVSEHSVQDMAGEVGRSLAQLGASLAERAAPFIIQTAVSSLAYSAGLAATQARASL